MEADEERLLTEGLHRAALVSATQMPRFEPLTGGVSSDIFLVEAGERRFVVKRALAKLRVAADWRVPVSRNATEAAWLKRAGEIMPGVVPALLAHDPQAGFIAMEFLDSASHPVWKLELREGRADPSFAGKVGSTLAGIHAATAGHPDIAKEVNDDSLFRAIRLEPYLEFTATRHPDLARQFEALVTATLANKLALVHGDVSPKNILVRRGSGAQGDTPIFLDAECAWYGDPAFDAAFCLNHLLLKCLWVPTSAAAFLACFSAFSDRYLLGADWEKREELEARIAALLPALLLARIDGKSPAEYLNDEVVKDQLRRFARRHILEPPQRLEELRQLYQVFLTNGQGA
jgi:aminoglycoside phosphotransferase (APT) family kinase protein